MLPRRRNLLDTAKDLRKNMTPEEKHLWYDFLSTYEIRFRRQEIIGCYIADFYCHKAKLVVEIDGAQHYSEDGACYDERRTAYISNFEIAVIRFSNYDIKKNFDSVCVEIDKIVKMRIKTLQSAAPTAPLKGEP